jgi:signal transduction histidine kinase
MDAAAGGDRWVVVVSDEVGVRARVADALGPAGCRVEGTPGSLAVVALLRGEDWPDVLVLDLESPAGRNVHEEVRAPRFAALSLIALTDTELTAAMVGADAVFPRRFAPTLLADAVNFLLSTRRHRAAFRAQAAGEPAIDPWQAYAQKLQVLAAALPQVEAAYAELCRRVGVAPVDLTDPRDRARVDSIRRYLETYAPGDDESAAPVDVRELISIALEIAAVEIGPRARLDLQLAAVPEVVAPRRALGHALFSLILNAAQAVPEGAPERHQLHIATSRDPDGRVRVTIRDTGRGIPAELREKVFQPHFSTKQGGGMGLGLTLARDTVRKLGGELTLESTVGVGTTVRVVLPRGAGA